MNHRLASGMERANSSGRIVDIHVHVLGGRDPEKRGVISREFSGSPCFEAMFGPFTAASVEEGREMIDGVLIDAVNTSQEVDCCVLLAVDGVHKNGRLAGQETHFMVPNAYVSEIGGRNSRTLFGASVHPYRDKKDMLNQTERCIDGGAVLFSWAPVAQKIDPEDDRCVPFYVRLVRAGVPLLCRAGGTFTGAPQDPRTVGYDNPRKLEKALDIGVKIIASHGPSGEGAAGGSGYFDSLISMLVQARERRWDLYVDTSSFHSREGLSCLERLKSEIDLGNISEKRLLYGSDFPFSSENDPAPAGSGAPITGRSGNPIDGRIGLARELGIFESAFTNAWSVLRS